MQSVTAVPLGSSPVCGEHLVRINVPDVDIKSSEPYSSHSPNDCEYIFVCDRSGSMKHQFKSILNTAIPDALAAFGVTNKKYVHIVTFDSRTEHFTSTIPELSRSKLDRRGCTYMAPALGIVNDLLTTVIDPHSFVRIVVLSDGCVNDPYVVKRNATKLHKNVQERPGDIQVQMIRVTHNGPTADTSALAAIGCIATVHANENEVDLQDCPSASFMADIVVKSWQSVNTYTVELKSGDGNLRHSPMEEPRETLRLHPGDNYVLVSDLEAPVSSCISRGQYVGDYRRARPSL